MNNTSQENLKQRIRHGMSRMMIGKMDEKIM